MSFQITGFVFLRLKEVKLLDHVVFLFLVFLWTSILFPIVVAPIYIPTIVQDSPSVLPLPTLVFWQQSLWLVWVGISLWLWLAFGDMEHLFMYLSVCTSHLETCLFRSSTHLSIVLFEGFFWCWVCNLCILDVRSSSDIICKYIPQDSCSCLLPKPSGIISVFIAEGEVWTF